MKYAFYETVTTEAEKEARMNAIREQKKTDKNLYSGYVDVLPKFDTPRSHRRGMQSLMAAIRKQRIDVLVIPSYENLQMDEHYAMVTLLQIQDLGVQIALGNPTWIQSEAGIINALHDAQLSYIVELICTTDAAEKDCYVDTRFDPPFVVLEQDHVAPHPWLREEKIPFSQLIEDYRDSDISLYRKDRDAWFYIPSWLMQDLSEIYNGFYDVNL